MRRVQLVAIILLIFFSCSTGEDDLILGDWQVVEYSVSGNKYESKRTIRFNSNGKYLSYEDGDTVNGEWRIKNETLVLHQPEIKDLHGKRLVEPFTRVWHASVAEEWLMLEGTSRSNTADMRLILKRK